jgi:malonyl-CoA O-methyltransferase
MISALKVLSWIKTNSIKNKGVAISSRQQVSYPEVTGYLIPTLYRMGEKDLARQYARWLARIQRPDGSYCAPREKISFAFDTGQVLRGLVRALPELPELEKTIVRACDWLINHSPNGRMPLPKDLSWWSLGKRGIISEAIHLYALPAVRQAGLVLNHKRYVDFVDRSKNYYLKNFIPVDFTQPNMLTHFYMYIQEALCELDAADLAAKGMREIATYQRRDGSLPAYSDVSWICSTGQAQAAVVWFRLGELEAGNRALHHLKQLMNPSGGFFGGYGDGADYLPDEEISWAAKFFLDASHWQIQTHFDHESKRHPKRVAYFDGRLKAILDMAGPLDGKDVLDVGCGKGRYLVSLKRKFPRSRLIGIDLSEVLLKHVPKNIARVQGSMLDMPFPDGKFDVVYCVEALEHAVAIEQAVAEMCRVLKPGGTLLIIDKNAQQLGRLSMPSWEQWFVPDALAAILKEFCTKVSWKPITYDKGSSADGWFIAWRGTKRSEQREYKKSINNDAKNSRTISTSGFAEDISVLLQEQLYQLKVSLEERLDLFLEECENITFRLQKFSSRMFRFLSKQYPLLEERSFVVKNIYHVLRNTNWFQDK